MAQQPDQAAATLAAYQLQSQALRDQIERFIRSLWGSYSEYRQPQMADFARAVTPIVQAGQRNMLSLTIAYLAAVLGGRVQTVNPTSVIGAAARNGVDPIEVYQRPFHLVWRQLHDLPRREGAIDSAIKSGVERAVSLAQTDLQLTKVQTSQRVLPRNANVVGYRRVLEGPHSCGLCIVASTQRYSTGKLLPIHPGCDCSVEPILGGQPADLVIDPALLSAVHQEIADRFGEANAGARAIPGQGGLKYRDVLIEHHHTELGPVLGVRGQDFHDLNDYAA